MFSIDMVIHVFLSALIFVLVMQEQYIFIHDAILEAVTCGDTQISASNLQRCIQILSKRDPETNLTGFESQFKACDMLWLHFLAVTIIAGTHTLFYTIIHTNC